MIVDCVVQNSLQFLNDSYGNYVIQYILELNGFREEKEQIGKKVSTNIRDLCNYKFSSNVIEKCIKVDLIDVSNALFETL